MEFLKEVIGDELYTQLESKLKGNDKIKLGNLASSAYIEKGTYDTEVATKQALEKQITSMESTVKELLKDAKGDKLEEKIKNFQDSIQQEKVANQKAFKELQLQTAIKLAVAGKVQDEDIVLSLLKKDEIVLDDTGKIKSGLNEQLEDLQKSKSFLFVPESKNKLFGVTPADGSDKQEQGSGNIDPAVSLAKSIAGAIKSESSAENPYFK